MAHAVISTLSSATGTYGATNECVGQVVTQLLAANAALVVISDNNPAATVKRVVTLKMGANMHYLRVEAYNTTSLNISIRNVADSATLNPTLVSYTDPLATITINTATFYLISGPNTLVILNPNASGYATTSFGFAKAANGNWYALAFSEYSTAGVVAFSTVDDTNYGVTTLSAMHVGLDGTIPLISVYISDTANALTTLNSVYMANIYELNTGGVYVAGGVTYCYYMDSDLGGILISDS